MPQREERKQACCACWIITVELFLYVIVACIVGTALYSPNIASVPRPVSLNCSLQPLSSYATFMCRGQFDNEEADFLCAEQDLQPYFAQECKPLRAACVQCGISDWSHGYPMVCHKRTSFNSCVSLPQGLDLPKVNLFNGTSCRVPPIDDALAEICYKSSQLANLGKEKAPTYMTASAAFLAFSVILLLLVIWCECAAGEEDQWEYNWEARGKQCCGDGKQARCFRTFFRFGLVIGLFLCLWFAVTSVARQMVSLLQRSLLFCCERCTVYLAVPQPPGGK